VLLDQPHTADVRALEASQFHVADAATILRIDPIALLYVATVLAQRLDSANRGLLELKRQFRAASRAASLEERSRRSKNCWAPRVPILCMPAILMTRLHPTHRGAETSRPTTLAARNSCVRPLWAGSRLSSFLSRASPATEHRV
jgi:hypothetical protein